MNILYLKNKVSSILKLKYDIFKDDTIENIKKKIAISLYDEKKVNIEEIYLFTKTRIKLSTITVYKLLSNNYTTNITYDMIEQFCKNYPDISLDVLSKKKHYTYFDLLELNFDLEQINFQSLSIYTNNYLFIANPYDCINFTTNILVNTQNSKLLLDINNIVNNELYFVLAEDLYNNIKNDKQIEYITSLYFPFLYEKNITNNESLINSKKNNYLNDNFNNNEEINSFIISSKNISELKKGISSIVFNIYPKYIINFPLENLFNYLHTSELYPMLKYNPGNKIENLIKLYSNNVSVNNEKIPFLNKKTIFDIKNNYGLHSNKLVIYINFNSSNTLICEIDQKGIIIITLIANNNLELKETNNLLLKHVNDLLTIINNYLEQFGYLINFFEGIYSSNINIISINYVFEHTINSTYKNLINDKNKCLTRIFNVLDINDDNHFFNLSFKKISNFSNMNADELLIQDLLNKTLNIDEISEKLKDTFPEKYNNIEQAQIKVTQVINDLKIQADRFDNMKLRTIKHPGFTVIGVYDKLTKILTSYVNKINNINYLSVLDDYFTFIYNLLNNSINQLEFENMCNKKTIKDAKINDLTQIIDEPSTYTFLPSNNIEGETFDDIIIDDDDDDDDDGDDDDFYMEGGTRDDVEGIKLKNPNYFEAKMKKLDPELFPVEKTPGYNSYSVSCPSNLKRQPVILTEDEMKYIEENHRDSYHSSIKYGTGKTKYYYICPRYWSFKYNTSISRKDLEDGKYGGLESVIPDGSKKIPEGKSIFEFSNNTTHIEKDGSYSNMFPGFLNKEKHPKGHCMPCCFKLTLDKKTNEYKISDEHKKK